MEVVLLRGHILRVEGLNQEETWSDEAPKNGNPGSVTWITNAWAIQQAIIWVIRNVTWEHLAARFLVTDSLQADRHRAEHDKNDTDQVVEAKFLSVDEVIYHRRDQWLYGPNRRNYTNIYSAQMREIHRHEYRTHDSEENEAHYNKQEQVPCIKLTVVNDVVPVPDVGHIRVPEVPHRHDRLVDEASNKGSEAKVENAGKAINMGRDNTNGRISKEETNDCSEGWSHPL